jgi:integral membrane sensor domain MASE1
VKWAESFRKLALVLLLAGIYWIAGKVGLRLAFVNRSATAVWPPTGISLAALLVLGYQVWPAVFLGAFLANITTAGSVATSVAIAVGNTLEALAGCYLVNRFAHGHKAFSTAQDIFRFAVLAGLLSTAISATIGVTSLSLGGLASWSDYRPIWTTWWLGDAGGALVVTPLLVLWFRYPHLRWNRSQLAEAVILLASIFLIGQNVFGGLFSASSRNYPLEFLCIPFLIWTAFRFSPRETATAVFVIAEIAIWGTLAGFGPFVRDGKNESLLLLQVYVSVSAVMGLALAALVSERQEIQEKLQQLATTDPVTGLANYRRFMEVLTEEIRRSQRTGSRFAVLLLDLDGMKQINDCHGGDEFSMLLLETDGTAAQQVASRVRERLAADHEVPRLAVGIGVSTYPDDGETIEDLLEAADRALYRVKRRGGVVKEESL